MQQLSARFFVVSGLILAAVISRWVPHAPNFSPVMAMALTGGALFGRRWLSFAVPLVAMFISDWALGFHDTLWAVYLSMALAVMMGWGLETEGSRKQFWMSGVLRAFIASFVFFMITNFAVWMTGVLYPKTWDGLVQCYVMAIPFFHYTLISTVMYTVAILGVYLWIVQRWPALITSATEKEA